MINLFGLSKPHNVQPCIALEILSKTPNLKMCGFSCDDPLFDALRKHKQPVLPYTVGALRIMGGVELDNTVFVFYDSEQYNECMNVVVLPNHHLQNQFVPLDVSFVCPPEFENQDIALLHVYAEGIKVGEIGTDNSDHYDPSACFYRDEDLLQQAIEYKNLQNTVKNLGANASRPKI